MTTEPRLTIAFTGVDAFRAAWHHGQPGPVPESWHRRLIRETRALQGLSEHIEDDPVNVELAVRHLASAAPIDSSAVRRGAVESVGTGAAQASPLAPSGRRRSPAGTAARDGEAKASPSSPRRSTNDERPAVRAAGLKNNAG